MHFHGVGPWIRRILPSGLHNSNSGIHHLPSLMRAFRHLNPSFMSSLLDDPPPCFDDAASCDPTLLTQMKSLVSECWVGKENAVGLERLYQVWWNFKFTMSHWIPINKTLFLKVSLNLDEMLALFGEDMSKKNEYEFVYSYTRQQFYRWGAFPVLSRLQFLSIRPRANSKWTSTKTFLIKSG